jgi:hypothetical protein
MSPPLVEGEHRPTFSIHSYFGPVFDYRGLSLAHVDGAKNLFEILWALGSG